MESLRNMTTEQSLRYLTREIYSIDSDGDFDNLVHDGINMLAAIKACSTFSGYRDLCNEAEDIINELETALLSL